MPSVGFKCLAKEAELICELLKHGAKPSSQFIQLSSVIRICALGLLKGHQCFASAGAMMVSVYLCALNFSKHRSISFL